MKNRDELEEKKAYWKPSLVDHGTVLRMTETKCAGELDGYDCGQRYESIIKAMPW